MLENINETLWSIILILIIGTGIFLTVKLRFFQFIRFPFVLRHTFFAIFKKSAHAKDKHSVSQFQTLSTALAATMGTGNIIGVASAIATGGAGAIFWMWISAYLGMAVIYAENVLGTVFRYKNEKNEWIGGTPAYLERGLKCKPLASVFSVLCILASFGMGNMAQSNSIAEAAYETFGIIPLLTGIVIAFFAGIVIVGGIKRIGNITSIIIPFLSILYIFASIIIIALNFKALPEAFNGIFRSAWDVRAAGGGIGGYAIKKAVDTGFRRGIFSNEAGLGSSGLLHSAAYAKSPEIQGMWGIFEVFVDTVVCCTLTALVILTTGTQNSGGASMIINAFTYGFGKYAAYFITFSILLFAFSTLIGWSYCGECCVRYSYGESAVKYYKIAFLFVIVLGAVIRFGIVWELSDMFNGLMALPNLFALIMLHKYIKPPKR